MEINQTVAVAGAKGGVGKTTTSLNVGAAAAADGQRTVVVELDLAMANTLDFISFPSEEPEPTLHDVLAGDADVRDAVYEVRENFAIAPSGTGLEGYADVDFDRLPSILETLGDAFDLVIVDTGAGLSRATVEPLRLADATVLVSTPRVAAIRDADKTKQVAERVDTPVCGLVLAKSGTGAAPGPGRIADFLDVSLLGHVPEDPAVPSSQDQGVPVVESAPDSDAATKYREVTGDLLFRLDTGMHREDHPVADDSELFPDAGSQKMVKSAVDVDPDPAIERAVDSAAGSDSDTDDDTTGKPTADTEDLGPATEEDAERRAATDGRGGVAAVRRRDDVTDTTVDPEYTPLGADAATSTDGDSGPDTTTATADGDGRTDAVPVSTDSDNGEKNAVDESERGIDRAADETTEGGSESGKSSLAARVRSLVGL